MIFDYKDVPHNMKPAFKIPIPKKNDAIVMDLFRGLSISTILYKFLEAVNLLLYEPTINCDQNDLQFGFTRNLSPFMASLIITEALAEAHDTMTELYACSLDARKAFDVVYHPLLKLKLFKTGIPPNAWGVIDQLYSDCTEQIRWSNKYSRLYKIEQGVKQGGLMSAPLYKMYSNSFACHIRNQNIGFRIGTINVSTPIDADDTMLLANNPFELQTMMNYSNHNAGIQFFENHPTKSAVTTLLKQKHSIGVVYYWMLGEKPAIKKEMCEHLGLHWKEGELAPKVDNRITLARRTSFALTGIGIHDRGINPVASLGIIRCYVEPRLLTGLNATVLSKEKMKEMDRYYHKLMRQIRGIPMNAAREATYLFLNILPVEALHRVRIMELFGQICRLPESHTLRNIAMRQLSVKTNNSKSWFIHACVIGEYYGLNLYQEFLNTKSRLSWKNTVKKGCTIPMLQGQN